MSFDPTKDPDGKEQTPDLVQVGGKHYKGCPPEFQHWNLVIVHNWDYFQGQIIKYVMRWKDKNGVEDLKKARHTLDKYIEAIEQDTSGMWNQGFELHAGLMDGKPVPQMVTELRHVGPFDPIVPLEIAQAAHKVSVYFDELNITRWELDGCRNRFDKDAAQPHPSVVDAGTQRKQTGWIGYTFEGGSADWDLYTCSNCRSHFQTPPNINPNDHHKCPAPEEPTAGYVDQG